MEKDELFATETLRASRTNRGLTQQEMADILSMKLRRGISLSLYQKWEQGTRPVNTKTAVAIAREFDLRLKELWETRNETK